MPTTSAVIVEITAMNCRYAILPNTLFQNWFKFDWHLTYQKSGKPRKIIVNNASSIPHK